jgi:hypothetical protein
MSARRDGTGLLISSPSTPRPRGNAPIRHRVGTSVSTVMNRSSSSRDRSRTPNATHLAPDTSPATSTTRSRTSFRSRSDSNPRATANTWRTPAGTVGSLSTLTTLGRPALPRAFLPALGGAWPASTLSAAVEVPRSRSRARRSAGEPPPKRAPSEPAHSRGTPPAHYAQGPPLRAAPNDHPAIHVLWGAPSVPPSSPRFPRPPPR